MVTGLTLLLFTTFANATDLTGRVVHVADGDTLTVLVSGWKKVKIRLAEIDAPELGQAGGLRSKKSLIELTRGQMVMVRVWTRDDYGRTVGAVSIGGRNLGAEQIQRGMAWVYRKYAKTKSLYALEKEAKKKHRGLWSDSSPMPPWEWRHRKRKPTRFNSGFSALYRCGSKKTCRQMISCQEARYFLLVCRVKGLDRDKDGVPCEKLCKK